MRVISNEVRDPSLLTPIFKGEHEEHEGRNKHVEIDFFESGYRLRVRRALCGKWKTW